MISLGLQAIDWSQRPNVRERIMFFAALTVFFLGFLKACWFPSRAAISELHGEIGKLNQEKRVASRLVKAVSSGDVTAPPAGALIGEGAGSIRDVQEAVETLSQPLLLKGVKLSGVKVADLEREGNMVRQKIELQLSGSFYSVAEYLEAVEHLRAPLVIEDFSIALNDDKRGRVLATVNGSFYGMDK